MSVKPENRPWGCFENIVEEPHYKVKRITVKVGKRLSLQSHERRSEHWFIVSGEGTVTLDEKVIPVHEGSSVDIPAGKRHRIENTGPGMDLVFIEVQTGAYFGEDDIVRYEDDFGRAEL